MDSQPSTLAEVATPCFLVDIDRLRCNAKRMLDTCRKFQVDLRHHTKTHKTVEAADIMTDGSRRKIACSTLPECEMYADNGYEDILLAYSITADKIPRCSQLTNRLSEFHVMLSGAEGVTCLREGASRLADGKHWSVFVEIDTGLGRSGFSWDSEAVVQAAREVDLDPHMKVTGVYTHCGHSYAHVTPEQRAEDQKVLVARITDVVQRLKSAGVEVTVVGTGSTPTCSLPDPVLSTLNEFHPGNYVFYDYQQLLLGACGEGDVACCVATRVVSCRPELGTLLVDCGFMALSCDGRKQRGDDFCFIMGHPYLQLTSIYQELGKITVKQGKSINFNDFPVGTMLFIYPFHSCATAAMHDRYIIHSGQKVVGVWKPVKGW
ncbi:D-serine dehydratase-like [Babylonia areolata]|uniref:D-serine dehydratase-like n=1 Tax=Babylonia areolata TaxID=304850 RepID=UPI003FD1EB09